MYRRLVIGAAALLAAIAAVVMSVPASATTPPPPQHYVALGDSYASVGTLTALHGLSGCFRANDNYPSDLAAQLHAANFTDATCGSATTANLTQPQSVTGGTAPPQFDALTPDTDLVTLTISGNDLGFGSIIGQCAVLSLTNLFGNPCQVSYTSGGTDQLAAKIDALAPVIANVLQGIHQRAPRAKVVLVGYLRILPESGGCWPIIPIAIGDIPYLGGIEQKLNGMLGSVAQANGSLFVNSGLETGHDACQVPWVRWVEPVLPAGVYTPAHPNQAGQAHVADLIMSTLSQ